MMCPWLTHGFRLLSLGIEDGELEFGAHLGLGAADQQQVQRQVVFALLIQTLGINTQTPEVGWGGRGQVEKAYRGMVSILSSKKYFDMK